MPLKSEIMKNYNPHLIESSHKERLREINPDVKASYESCCQTVSELTPVFKNLDSNLITSYNPLAVAQAMLDSGFVNAESDTDSNLASMLNAIYGMKYCLSLQKFSDCYDALVEQGFTDHVGIQSKPELCESDCDMYCFSCDTLYEKSEIVSHCENCIVSTKQKRFFLCGDNYASAHTVYENQKVKLKAIILESQENLYGLIIHNKHTLKLSIVKIALSNKEKHRVKEFTELLNDGSFFTSNNHEWLSNKGSYGLVSSIDVNSHMADKVLDLYSLEQTLSMLHSTYCALLESL